MLILPDFFTPYMNGVETARKANWDDLNQFEKVRKERVLNDGREVSFWDNAQQVRNKADAGLIANSNALLTYKQNEARHPWTMQGIDDAGRALHEQKLPDGRSVSQATVQERAMYNYNQTRTANELLPFQKAFTQASLEDINGVNRLRAQNDENTRVLLGRSGQPAPRTAGTVTPTRADVERQGQGQPGASTTTTRTTPGAVPTTSVAEQVNASVGQGMGVDMFGQEVVVNSANNTPTTPAVEGRVNQQAKTLVDPTTANDPNGGMDPSLMSSLDKARNMWAIPNFGSYIAGLQPGQQRMIPGWGFVGVAENGTVFTTGFDENGEPDVNNQVTEEEING